MRWIYLRAKLRQSCDCDKVCNCNHAMEHSFLAFVVGGIVLCRSLREIFREQNEGHIWLTTDIGLPLQFPHSLSAMPFLSVMVFQANLTSLSSWYLSTYWKGAVCGHASYSKKARKRHGHGKANDMDMDSIGNATGPETAEQNESAPPYGRHSRCIYDCDNSDISELLTS